MNATCCKDSIWQGVRPCTRHAQAVVFDHMSETFPLGLLSDIGAALTSAKSRHPPVQHNCFIPAGAEAGADC